MEILRKILEILSDFLRSKEEEKVEKEEIKRLEVEQAEKVQKVKKKEIKPPKKEDFFNDDSW
jgi:hypothetical protein